MNAHIPSARIKTGHELEIPYSADDLCDETRFMSMVKNQIISTEGEYGQMVEVRRKYPLSWGSESDDSINSQSQDDYYRSLCSLKDIMDSGYTFTLDCIHPDNTVPDAASLQVNVSGRNDTDMDAISEILLANGYWLGFLSNPRNYLRLRKRKMNSGISGSHYSDVRQKKYACELRVMPTSNNMEVNHAFEYLVAGLVMGTIDDNLELSACRYMNHPDLKKKAYTAQNRDLVYPPDSSCKSPADIMQTSIHVPEYNPSVGRFSVSYMTLDDMIGHYLDTLKSNGHISREIYRIMKRQQECIRNMDTFDLEADSNGPIRRYINSYQENSKKYFCPECVSVHVPGKEGLPLSYIL